MVKSCSAYGCTNRATSQNRDLKFFRFPTNPVKLKIWLRNIRRVDSKNKVWKPSNHSWICSEHFKPECMYFVREGGRTRLKDEAVPTEFNFSSNLRRQNKQHQSTALPVIEDDPTSEEAVSTKLNFPSDLKRPNKQLQPTSRQAVSPSALSVTQADPTSDHSYVSTYNSELDEVKADFARLKNSMAETQKKLRQTRQKLKEKIEETENLKDILIELRNNELLKYEGEMFISLMLPELTSESFRNSKDEF